MGLRFTILTMSLCGVLLLGCSQGADVDSGHGPPADSWNGQDGGHASSTEVVIAGSYLVVSLKELIDASELVVRGSPTGRTTVYKSPAESPGYPADLKVLDKDVIDVVDRVTFRVDEYYKGSGPSEIPVWASPRDREPAAGDRRPRMIVASGDEIVLEEGVPYILFLFRSPSEEGKAYWDYGYLVHGIQGVWIVKGDRAVRQFGAEYSDLPLTRIRDLGSDLIRP